MKDQVIKTQTPDEFRSHIEDLEPDTRLEVLELLTEAQLCVKLAERACNGVGMPFITGAETLHGHLKGCAEVFKAAPIG